MTDKIIRIKLDASQANRDIAQLDSGMRQAGGAADELQTAITRVAAAVATAFSTRQVLAYADAFTNIQNQLRIVTNGTEELTTVTASLLQIANDTRAAFDATADLYSKLARSTEELGVSQERLLRITDTINKTFATSGASADAARNAIIQLGQGLSAGALRGDEFNSVAEQAPGILRAVSAETGKTIGQLREFAAQGGITAELLIRSIENYADTVNKEFADTNRTFEESLQTATNNAVAFIGANEQVQYASKAAGNAVVLLSENLDVLAKGAALIASVIAARYVSAMTLSAVATLKTATAATAAAAAMRGLTASMAALGGPLGILFIAASAFLIFSTNAKEAETVTANLIPVNELLTQSYDNLTAAQARNTRNIINQRISALEEERAAIQKTAKIADGLSNQEANEFLKFIGSDAVADLGQAADSTQSKVDTLNQQIEKLRGRLVELDEVGTKPAANSVRALGDNLDALRKVSSGIDSLFSGEFNLFGDSGEQTDDQQARIEERIAALRLETQTSAAEYEIRRQVLNGFLLQEEADIQIASERRLQQAISQRDLLLQEETLTNEQRLETLQLFEQQKMQIEMDSELARTELAREQMLQRMQMEAQTQQTYLETAQIGIGALANLVGGSTKAGKALKLIQAGVNAFQVFAASQTAAALILATPPGPVLNPSLVPLAASVIAKGKISAAAIMAGAVASTFSGGGGGIGSVGGGSGGATATLPTTPTAAPLVGSVEISGLQSLTDELRNSDAQLPAPYVARILDAIQSANRLRGEDI